ncbi:hypothetical protein, partial [Bradyrhizobium sp. CCBAU 11361]|uniref:hypothetical protein n=1 Tax=Bradyrhizobium sp. CCBAU 11361 TaxID=1630812 RepID=UPI002303C095
MRSTAWNVGVRSFKRPPSSIEKITPKAKLQAFDAPSSFGSDHPPPRHLDAGNIGISEPCHVMTAVK